MKDIDVHIHRKFFSRNYALFKLGNMTKIKFTTETVCQRISSETAQQNFVKLCSNERHNVYICISTGNFDSIVFPQNYANFELSSVIINLHELQAYRFVQFSDKAKN